ncbi:hypothetical protein DPMN_135944 [Dreissena polymorpha]|uniref:Uncharacterized protein n=1 Tax=Dreissena polymorpha TaxID=45954 RepID=A0A9D4G2R1_DREPO|nr:hypothetical protein DPMN_135944 [Dreissena polymorpha]
MPSTPLVTGEKNKPWVTTEIVDQYDKRREPMHVKYTSLVEKSFKNCLHRLSSPGPLNGKPIQESIGHPDI